jgi:hypothetical protein
MQKLGVPLTQISKWIGLVIQIRRHTTSHMCTTTHRLWIDWEAPCHPWRRMTRRSWLCYLLGRFSWLLLSHRSPFWLRLFYWPVVWNDLLHIFGKQLIKTRVDSAESARHLESVLLPNTCFGTLWSDGLRFLLLLVICGPSDLHSRTVRVCLGLSGLSTRSSGVCRIGDRDWVSDRACPPVPLIFLLSEAFRVTTLRDIFGMRG